MKVDLTGRSGDPEEAADNERKMMSRVPDGAALPGRPDDPGISIIIMMRRDPKSMERYG